MKPLKCWVSHCDEFFHLLWFFSFSPTLLDDYLNIINESINTIIIINFPLLKVLCGSLSQPNPDVLVAKDIFLAFQCSIKVFKLLFICLVFELTFLLVYISTGIFFPSFLSPSLTNVGVSSIDSYLGYL